MLCHQRSGGDCQDDHRSRGWRQFSTTSSFTTWRCLKHSLWLRIEHIVDCWLWVAVCSLSGASHIEDDDYDVWLLMFMPTLRVIWSVLCVFFWWYSIGRPSGDKSHWDNGLQCETSCNWGISGRSRPDKSSANNKGSTTGFRWQGQAHGALHCDIASVACQSKLHIDMLHVLVQDQSHHHHDFWLTPLRVHIVTDSVHNSPFCVDHFRHHKLMGLKVVLSEQSWNMPNAVIHSARLEYLHLWCSGKIQQTAVCWIVHKWLWQRFEVSEWFCL